MNRASHAAPLRAWARTAGLGYLVIIVTGVFAELFVRRGLLVPGDAAATAVDIVASEALFRVGIASEFVMLGTEGGVAPGGREADVDFELTAAIAVLERTPSVLRTWLGGLPERWTHRNEGPDTWSPFDVVGHLIDGEGNDWMVRARIILAQGEDVRFEPFDRFRHLRVNRGRSLEELLERFADLRARNLRALAALDLGAGEMALTGEHPEFGTVTLAQLLATWVAHDLGHLAQIGRVMAKQYRDAVGPWEAHLPVLHR